MKTIKLPTGVFKYDTAKPLGKRGGFGQVFLGLTAKGEEVAVKKLHLSAAEAAHRELSIADELKGRSFEHVVLFLDAGQDADTGDYYVVMPKAEGSLQDELDKSGPFAHEKTAGALLQIVEGLLEVGGLVHRDMKPDNVLSHEGKWKIADFGIARFVEEATSANTMKNCLSPAYAAPEQWKFERATHATDVYALGCIAYCLLTGRPPFTNDPQWEHQNSTVPPFNCADARLKTLVNMCLRKVASSRPTLSRVRDLMAGMIAKPQPAEGAGSLAALASAAVYVSTKEQEAQARQAAENTARESRTQLAKSGYEILKDNAERLWGKIHLHAPNAKRMPATGLHSFECRIGKAQLVMDFGMNEVAPKSFAQSGWDVVAFSLIEINQPEPQYSWSASLWFARLQGETDYRWHEVSYWSWSGHKFHPFALTPGKDADFAGSNISHSVSIAYGPVTVDDEQEDDFHDRWIWLLSMAALGQLRQPNRMPFSWPPQLS